MSKVTCPKCGAKGRYNYPFGKKSKGRASVVHYGKRDYERSK